MTVHSMIQSQTGRFTNEFVDLRGAPSAISMAVIPKDQISLWKMHKGAG